MKFVYFSEQGLPVEKDFKQAAAYTALRRPHHHGRHAWVTVRDYDAVVGTYIPYRGTPMEHLFGGNRYRNRFRRNSPDEARKFFDGLRAQLPKRMRHWKLRDAIVKDYRQGQKIRNTAMYKVDDAFVQEPQMNPVRLTPIISDMKDMQAERLNEVWRKAAKKINGDVQAAATEAQAAVKLRLSKQQIEKIADDIKRIVGEAPSARAIKNVLPLVARANWSSPSGAH